MRRGLELLAYGVAAGLLISVATVALAADPVDIALMNWFLRQPAWVRIIVGKTMVFLGLAP